MRWKRGNRLKLVNEDEASTRTRAIFAEIRDCLGLPSVPVLYRAYAAFPEFLELHWQAFRPLVESRHFFLLGARLAAESYTRAHNYFPVPSLVAREAQSETSAIASIAQVLDYYQYLDPLLLLIATVQLHAFEGPVGQAQRAPDEAQHPNFPVAPHLLQETEAPAAIQRIWEERRRLLELAFISDEHRALACWPSFYPEYWSALKELLRSPLYTDCQFRIGESARGMLRELPVKVETEILLLLDAGLDDDEISSLVRIHEGFVQALPGLLLDITFARIAREGGTRNGFAPTSETLIKPDATRVA